MSNPWDSFQQGMMTGRQVGTDMRQRRNTRELGGLMASGNIEGARAAAFGQGDLQTGLALDGRVQQQAAAQRGGQQTQLLQAGDYDGAEALAQSPQELQSLRQFRNSADEATRAAAAARAGEMAQIGQAVRSLPPEQRLPRAQQLAQEYGIDSAQITPDTVTDEALEAFTMRALGLKEYLDYKQDERDANSPRYVPALGGFIMPQGSAPQGGQPAVLGSTLPPGWQVQPRPNQPSSARAAGGGERSQTPRVSFQTPQEARSHIERVVPGVRPTSGTRTPEQQRRLIAQWEANGRKGVRPADNSYHMQARAWDLVPPPGMSMAQLASKMRSEGFRVLNEGNHIHVSW